MDATGNTIQIAGGGWPAQAGAGGDDAANPGLASFTLDIEDPSGIASFARQLTAKFPTLNVLINNAGIMRLEKLQAHDDLTSAEAIIATNLLGPMRLTSALLPQLKGQQHSVIMNVSSGLGFVPMSATRYLAVTYEGMAAFWQSAKGEVAELMNIEPSNEPDGKTRSW